MSDTQPKIGLLSTGEVASIFKVSKITVRRWWALGHIPSPIKIGGSLRWRRADLLNLIREREPVR